MSQSKPKETLCINVPHVVGTGECQTLVVTKVHFPDPVFEIKEIKKTVIIEKCHVVCNKVILNGTLEKDINFKTREHQVSDCEGSKRQVCGDVRHCTVFIPFECCIDVKGAQEGDRCKIEFAGVEGEVDEPLNPDCDGFFTELLEKNCIKIIVKVIRDTQVSVNPTHPDACPVIEKCPAEEDHAKEKASATPKGSWKSEVAKPVFRSTIIHQGSIGICRHI